MIRLAFLHAHLTNSNIVLWDNKISKRFIFHGQFLVCLKTVDSEPTEYGFNINHSTPGGEESKYSATNKIQMSEKKYMT